MTRQDPPPKLHSSSPELRAWRALMTVHGRVTPLLDQQLRSETDLDLTSYDALLHTYEAGTDGVRMADLADLVVLSKSGLTTVVDRLEERGFVRRIPDPVDRRATRITVTDEGVDAFREAAAVHLSGITEHFARFMTPEEAGEVAGILERVLEADTDR